MPQVLFAGSFNPPTIAHRRIVERLRSVFDVPVTLMPVTRVAHKDPATLAPFAHRLNMAQLLVQGMADVNVSTLADTVDSVQSIDLIRAWRTRHTGPLIWVMGADSFVSLPQWAEWQHIMESVALYVLPRAEQASDLHNAEAAKKFAAAEVQVANGLLKGNGWYIDAGFGAPDISASAVRAGNGQAYLTNEVCDYIAVHKLYT